MKQTIRLVFFLWIFGCSSQQSFSISEYHERINQAEINICRQEYKSALLKYKEAFATIDKPFGKDVFNAALVCGKMGDTDQLLVFLQMLNDNSMELAFVQSTFVGKYIDSDQWGQLLEQRQPAFDPALRAEFRNIYERDQLFRPMYETHDDTINANRILNLNRIKELSLATGFPAHQELGYTENLRGQDHHIVLHHTAQRRSKDKSVMDLESLLRDGVEQGRLDPEKAIYFINFQNDPEKGRYEVYPIVQYRHPSLSDSLTNQLWLPLLDENQKEEANQIRNQWYANSLSDIALKTYFLNNSKDPFIFTSIRRNIVNLSLDMDEASAYETYQILTSQMEKYLN